MQVSPRPLLGVLCVIGAAMLWGTTGTSQALAGGSLPSLWFGALRLAFATVFFAAFAGFAGGLVRGAWQGLSPIPVIGAGLCMAAYNLTFFEGLRLTGVGVGTAIALGSGPIWAGLLQAVFQGQPTTAAWWAGTVVAIAGGALLSLGGGELAVSVSGVVLCLAAGLSYAIYTLLNKRLVAHAPASSITLAAFAVAALLSLCVAAAQASVPVFGARDVIAVAYTGVITAGLGYLLFGFALHHIRPATAVTLALVEPVVAFVLAVLLLGESANLTAVCGLILVVVGVLGVVRNELASPPARAQAA